MSDPWEEIRAMLLVRFRAMTPEELRLTLMPHELRALRPYLRKVRVADEAPSRPSHVGGRPTSTGGGASTGQPIMHQSEAEDNDLDARISPAKMRLVTRS